jgi:glucuronate isomerase
MDTDTLARGLGDALDAVPLLDAHTHLDATHLAARGLHDVLLYHMVVSDLVSAGCPDRDRLGEQPTGEEARIRIERALPFLPGIRNTSCSWGLRIILEDLYGWRGPVGTSNWKRLDAMIRERSGDAAWQREILRRAGIRRSCTELWRRHDGRADELLQYSLEWCCFTRCQRDEFDTAVYELEKAWSEGRPGAPSPVTRGAARPVPARTIRTVAEAHAALDAYVAAIPPTVLSTAQGVSTDIDYREVDERAFAAALRRRRRAGPEERDVYSSWINEQYLARLERERPGVAFQFSLGAEPLPAETASRVSQRTLAQVAAMVARHPGIRFQCFLSSAHANQTLCTIARELHNFSLAGYWWHSFFPAFIARVMSERLDMLAASRQVGFFSDAYTLEWSYAKAVMVRTILARVLAERVSRGQYGKDDALAAARAMLYESPQALLGMRPRMEGKPARRAAGKAAGRSAAKTTAARRGAKKPDR